MVESTGYNGEVGDVRGLDLFPDLGEAIDEKVSHSEMRVKSWILGGLLGQLIVICMAVAPVIFYLGQISRDLSQVSAQMAEQKHEAQATAAWRSNRMIWESTTEQWMISKGYNPPRVRE